MLLRMKNILEDSCRENQNTNFTLNTFFENRAFYAFTLPILFYIGLHGVTSRLH